MTDVAVAIITNNTSGVANLDQHASYAVNDALNSITRTETETWHNGPVYVPYIALQTNTLVCNVIVMGDGPFALRSHIPKTTLVQ